MTVSEMSVLRSRVAGDDGYPSVSETAMGKSASTVPGKCRGVSAVRCHPALAAANWRVCQRGAGSRATMVSRIVRLPLTYDRPTVWWNNLEPVIIAVDELDCRDLLA
jgi:hypothetical protein